MELFALYLLDGISKTVQELYANRYSSFVVSLYLKSYSYMASGASANPNIRWLPPPPHMGILLHMASSASGTDGLW